MIRERLPAPTAADRVVGWITRNWIWLLNGLALIYAGLPWLSPLLRSSGFERAGVVIYRMYTTLCHQIAERSFTFRGYQVCYCHRCTALYTSILAAGVIFGLMRPTRGISTRLMVLLVVPMAIDGGWHLLDEIIAAPLRSPANGIDSLNFWLRMITGVLAGVGLIFWAYPRMERIFTEEMTHSLPRRAA
jgi:uncharacterized membrane protein